MTELTPRQDELLALVMAGGPDGVRIVELHRDFYPAHNSRLSVREMQQRLSPMISRINKKLAAMEDANRVKPGRIKQTFAYAPV